jgi:hypothetical protein
MPPKVYYPLKKLVQIIMPSLKLILFFFLIKDRTMNEIMFRGPCHGGLYPLVPTSTDSTKHAFITLTPSSSTWHRHLGHPSSFIVQQVLRKNNLSHSSEINPYVENMASSSRTSIFFYCSTSS